MLAHDAAAEIGHPNVKASPAGRAFLNVIQGIRHNGTSYYRCLGPSDATNIVSPRGRGLQTNCGKFGRIAFLANCGVWVIRQTPSRHYSTTDCCRM